MLHCNKFTNGPQTKASEREPTPYKGNPLSSGGDCLRAAPFQASREQKVHRRWPWKASRWVEGLMPSHKPCSPVPNAFLARYAIVAHCPRAWNTSTVERIDKPKGVTNAAPLAAATRHASSYRYAPSFLAVLDELFCPPGACFRWPRRAAAAGFAQNQSARAFRQRAPHAVPSGPPLPRRRPGPCRRCAPAPRPGR